MSIVSVYVVFADADEAARVGRAVVDERLAACINILGPCTSIHRWQGKTEQAAEVAAILKTSEGSADALVARIAALHSYDVPCITTAPASAFGPYADWVEDSTG